MFNQNLSFRRQIVSIVTIGVVLLAIILSLATSWLGTKRTQKTLTEHGERITNNFAIQSTLSLLYGDGENAKDAIRATLGFPEVSYVAVYDIESKLLIEEGEALYRYDGPAPEALHTAEEGQVWLQQETDDYWRYMAPVYYSSGEGQDPELEITGVVAAYELLGHVDVLVSKATLKRAAFNILAGNMVLSFVLATVLILVLRMATTRITKPIQELSTLMGKAEEDNQACVRAKLQGPQEIQVMGQAFNAMMKAIEERDQQLREDKELLEERVAERTTDLVTARDQALEASRAKSAFLANMSHELRTPLNAIIGYSEMLREGFEDDGDEAGIADIDRVHSAGKHLLNLINEILDLSKIEAGKMNLYIDAHKVHDVVQDVGDMIGPLAKQNNNELIINIDEDIGEMQTDKTRLHQVLFNLMSNACKFTDGGTVTLTVQHERGGVVFHVEDTGIGIRKEDIQKLFRDFSQADASTTREYGGTGLGLAISKRFAEMMGGRIDVESEIGQGSSFSVHLPRQCSGTPVHVPAAVVPLDSQGFAQGQAGRVLIIDDDPIVCDLLRRTLQPRGFETHEASDGKTGIGLAKSLKPSVIILDVMMAGMDGWSVLTALKEDNELHHIPVIMLSMVDERDKGYELGVHEYLTKPVEGKSLLNAINSTRGTGAEQDLLLLSEKSPSSLGKLSLKGWRVHHARDCEEAINIAGHTKLSMVLVDFITADANVNEYMNCFCRSDLFSGVPTVTVVAHDDVVAEEVSDIPADIALKIAHVAFDNEELLGQLAEIVAKNVKAGRGKKVAKAS